MTKPNTRKQGAKQLLLSTLLGGVLSTLVVFVGAPMLRVLKRSGGGLWFWSSALLSVAISFLIAPVWKMSLLLSFASLSIWFTIAIYDWIETRGKATVWTALGAVLVGSLVGIGITWFYAVVTGRPYVTAISEDLLTSLGLSLPNAAQIDPSLLIQLLPGGLVLMNLAALAFALILDRRMAQFLSLRFEKVASQIKLLEFRAPDALIWVAMGSFLFSFLKMENQIVTIVAINVVGVMTAIYFFQGLAVFESILRILRLGPFVKLFAYFVLFFGQLFVMLSVLGIFDYWADFRKRFKKLMRTKGQTRNGENV